MCRLCPLIPLPAEPQGTDSGHIAPGPAIVAAILPSTSSSHSAQRLPGATADAPEKRRPRDPAGDAGGTLLRMSVPVAARRPGSLVVVGCGALPVALAGQRLLCCVHRL